MRFTGALALLLVALLFLVPAYAQLGTGTIMGRLTDPTGAVVPGVSVTVVNTATNFTSTAQTNEEGLFRVPSLQPGKQVSLGARLQAEFGD
jgi:hypothetical protein